MREAFVAAAPVPTAAVEVPVIQRDKVADGHAPTVVAPVQPFPRPGLGDGNPAREVHHEEVVGAALSWHAAAPVKVNVGDDARPARIGDGCRFPRASADQHFGVDGHGEPVLRFFLRQCWQRDEEQGGSQQRDEYAAHYLPCA
jgi:hypothetical protein